MNIRNFLYTFILTIFFLAQILGSPGLSQAATVDHEIWADLLGKYVKSAAVDYSGFKTEEERLDQYLKVLENTDPEKLSRAEQYAYYINAYNAWTIKLIFGRL